MQTDYPSCIVKQGDHVGAMPFHSLLLSNSEAAMDCILALANVRPALLCQQHLPPIFTGENALHILIVNGREKMLLKLLNIVTASFTSDQLKHLFTAQANGLFFKNKPQVYFGSTPLAYAACFGMKRIIQCMLLGTTYFRLSECVSAVSDQKAPIDAALTHAALIDGALVQRRTRRRHRGVELSAGSQSARMGGGGGGGYRPKSAGAHIRTVHRRRAAMRPNCPH